MRHLRAIDPQADEAAAEEAQVQAAENALAQTFGGYASASELEEAEAAATRADWAVWYSQDA